MLELPHPELVSVAAKAGCSHVGLRLVPVAGQPYLHPLDPGAIEKRLADAGVGVLDVEVFRLEAETKVADYEEAVAVSARLGASQLLVHGADESEARLIDSFGRLCDLAGKYKLGVNLEPMPWVAISTLAKAKRILDGACRRNGDAWRMRSTSSQVMATSRMTESVSRSGSRTSDTHPGSSVTIWNALAGHSAVQVAQGVRPGKLSTSSAEPM